MFWKWMTVIGFAMTPALILGQSAAAGAGIGFGFDPWVLVPVIAIAGFVEGLGIAWLGGKSAKLRFRFLQRVIEWLRKPRGVDFANRFGTWGALLLGTGIVGQEPVLIALRWMGVDFRRLVLPTAVVNAVYALIYWYVVKLGILGVTSTFEPLKALWSL